MRLPSPMRGALLRVLRRHVSNRRSPDFIIGGQDDPYLLRWYIIPRNRFLNVYLHHFLRSDDDRAMHDHPWCSMSVLLEGGYWEHVPGWAHHREEGAISCRGASSLHRVQLEPELREDRWVEKPCWTLFVTGPKTREWGFACPQGWRHWRDFTAGARGETIGRGCE